MHLLSFLKYIVLIMLLQLSHFFLPFIPLHSASSLPPAFLPPQFMSLGHTCKLFAFSISYTMLSYVSKYIKMIFYIYVNTYVLECTLTYVCGPYIISGTQDYWFPLHCASQGSFNTGSRCANHRLLRMMKTSMFTSLVNVVECLK